jgi:succinate dehydrogenase / fumarate reductase membrane anchor subunit
MVTQVLSLTRSGLSDFVVQRATAMFLTVYSVYVMGFFILTPTIDFTVLSEFFGGLVMQIASTIAILATLAHAWIGLWTIGTDYLRPAHVGGNATSIRVIYQGVCILAMFVYFVWAISLIW